MEMEVSVVDCGDRKVLLWLHTTEDPAQDAWDAALAMSANVVRAVNDFSKIVSLVITDGGAPSALQRRQLFTDLLQGSVKSAVVTTVLSNPMKRGVATALLWLNPNFRAFQPADYNRALAHLDLESHNAILLAGFRKLQAALPPNATLKLIEEVSKNPPRT